MRSFTTVLLAGAAGVLAQDAINYVQNYNGDVAGFTYVLTDKGWRQN